MNDDTIVQEVRDIRASIAAEFGYDRTKLIAWAREQTRQRMAAANAVTEQTPEASTAPAKSPVARKRRVLPAHVST
jgi:hypothetical protein